MNKIIGYARVSTPEQSENSHALEQQIERLKQAGATEILTDVESGSKDTRRQFSDLMKLVESRQVTEVVITRLDRLTRSLVTLRKTLDIFTQSGVNLKSLDDAIDLKTAAGKFQINMLGALAEMEVDRLSERVKHGWSHLRSRKVAMHPPFGYKKVDESLHLDTSPFLCLIEEQEEKSRSQIAREIIEVFFEKKTLRLTLREINLRYGIQTFAHNNVTGETLGGRIAQQMFRFSVGGLRNWLTSPVLSGHLCYLRGKKDEQIIYNTHPTQRLVSDVEAAEINKIIAHNKQVKGYGSTALKYPLSGLVFCEECRSSCYSLKGGRGKNIPGYNYYFQCKNWRLRACKNKQVVRMEKVELAAVSALREAFVQITDLSQIQTEAIVSPELVQLQNQLEGLKSLGNLGKNPAIESAIAELQNQIEVMKVSTWVRTDSQNQNRSLLEQTFQDPFYWHSLPDTEKSQIYRALISRVVVNEGEVVRVELRV